MRSGGGGKTHAAQALGHAACRAGFTVLFTKTAAFLRDLAGGRADGSWEPRLRKYLQTDVLILDLSRCRDYPVRTPSGPQRSLGQAAAWIGPTD